MLPAGYGCELDVTYTNSLTGTVQRASVYAPGRCADSASPLLVIAHFAGGDRFAARERGYVAECEQRGWLCVCPQLHGREMVERGAFGSTESLHDILDCVNLTKSRYRVDPRRVYMVGRSMGGMTTLLAVARYPDVFAAAVAGQPITDLRLWMGTEHQFSWFVRNVVLSAGACRSEAFEYERRSAVNFEPNFRYVPVTLWHGTDDPLVLAAQSVSMQRVLERVRADQPPVHWVKGATHEMVDLAPSWECDRLLERTNPLLADGGSCDRTLDMVAGSDGWHRWAQVERVNSLELARVTVEIDGAVVRCGPVRNVARLTLDLSGMGGAHEVESWQAEGVEGCAELEVRVGGEVRKAVVRANQIGRFTTV